MSKFLQRVLSGIFVLIFGAAVFMAGAYFYSNVFIRENDVFSTFLHYENAAAGFTIEYPSPLEPEETEHQVSFRNTTTEEPYALAVRWERVAFQNTESWLAAQAEGDMTRGGYEVIGHVGDDMLLIVQYVQIDSEVGQPIYGKVVSLVQVYNGTLYKIIYRNQVPVTEEIVISSEIILLAESFSVRE